MIPVVVAEDDRIDIQRSSFSAFRLRCTVSSLAPVSKSNPPAVDGNECRKPDSPNPSSASIVDKILTSTLLTRYSAGLCAAGA